MSNKKCIINDYGFWDLAGRNLFFRFPRFIFKEIRKGEKINEEQNSPDGIIDKAVYVHEKSTAIYVNDLNFKENFDKLINSLILNLLHNGRIVNKAVKVIDEVIIKVDSHPFLFKEILDIRLKTDKSISKFATIRPSESYDD